MRLHLFAAVLAATCAASFAAPPEPPKMPIVQSPDPLGLTPPAADAFEAVVRVDEKPGGKRFQGVWLERAEGPRLLIEYRALGCWTPFAGEKVSVTGASYSPEGQSIQAAHFKVATMELVDKSKPIRFISVGPVQELTGKFGLGQGAPGSKMADSTWDVFSGGGSSYLIANPSEIGKLTSQPAKVTAREVVRTPFSTHMGGRVLWLLSVSAP